MGNRLKIWILAQLEKTGREHDMLAYNPINSEIIFYDCSLERQVGRWSICYNSKGLESRKHFRSENNAVDMVVAMGIEL